jgi:glycosyltransferase involved in cell wall biosynthesis/peptidoglycan/xylan/chitin deacetylase (PgdA/CDA1 family)
VNILFLSNEFPTPADPGRAVFNGHMLRVLAQHHCVRVVCPVPWTEVLRGSHDPAAGAPEFPFPVFYRRFFFPPRVALHLRGTWMWWSLRGLLLKEVRRARPDVVFSYWAHPDGEVALRLGRQIGVPVALMVGGSDVLLLTNDAKRRRRVDAVLTGVDQVLAIGPNLAQQVVARGVPPARVTAILRPVAPRFTPGSMDASRQQLGLPKDVPVLLWVGRFVPVKGVETLLRAAALLKQEGRTFLLCLVGSGALESSLRALSTELGLVDAVRWVGKVAHDDLPAWYRAANLTVLPSVSEGVPNVLLESIACGTPFVATSVGSIPDIADDRRDRLVPPGRPPELARALSTLLETGPAPQPSSYRVSSEAEFQQSLDTVLTRCMAGARTYTPRTGVISATMVRPNQWRQLVRRLMLGVVPRHQLLASGPGLSRAVCLTFDDGPDEVTTPAILDALKHAGARATFFVRGDRASMRPALIRRIVDEGHLLGHHSWSHTAPHTTSAQQLLSEVERTRRWLVEHVGRDSTWFRPPHGKLSIAKAARLWAAGQTVALWNVDPGDVFCDDADTMMEWFRAHPPQSGDVVLLHDTSRVTAAAMPSLIATIREAGLELTTLDRLHAAEA